MSRSIQLSRKITVFLTASRKEVSFEIPATTYRDVEDALRTRFSESEFKLSEVKAFEANSKIEMVNGESQLPHTSIGANGAATTDLVFILTPRQKIKSGATMTRSELLAKIKELILAKPELKEIFNEGKNYTNKPSPVLEELLENYSKKGAKANTKVEEAPKKVAKAAPVKEEILTPKKDNGTVGMPKASEREEVAKIVATGEMPKNQATISIPLSHYNDIIEMVANISALLASCNQQDTDSILRKYGK